MKYRFLPLFIGILLLLGDSCFGETLRMAVFQLEPFMMKDPGKTEPTGVTVEYWRKWLAPRMGFELVVYGPYPIKRAEKMLENGEVDVVSQLTKIPERETRFFYPETPLTRIVSCITVKKESPITSVDKPEYLYGRKVGFMESAYIPPLLKDSRIKFDLVSNEDFRQINLNKLFAGRLDAVLDINHVSFLYYLGQHAYLDRLRIMLLPVDPVNVYSIFRKNERGRMLAGKYDEANREGLKQGVFNRITEEYLAGAVIVP